MKLSKSMLDQNAPGETQAWHLSVIRAQDFSEWKGQLATGSWEALLKKKLSSRLCLSIFGHRKDVPAPRVFLLLFKSILSPHLGNHTAGPQTSVWARNPGFTSTTCSCLYSLITQSHDHTNCLGDRPSPTPPTRKSAPICTTQYSQLSPIYFN